MRTYLRKVARSGGEHLSDPDQGKHWERITARRMQTRTHAAQYEMGPAVTHSLSTLSQGGRRALLESGLPNFSRSDGERSALELLIKAVTKVLNFDEARSL